MLINGFVVADRGNDQIESGYGERAEGRKEVAEALVLLHGIILGADVPHQRQPVVLAPLADRIEPTRLRNRSPHHCR